MYKFLWGNSFTRSKAPDRISRHKILASTSVGGFGHVDHEAICQSINAKQALASLQADFYHPLGTLLRKIYNASYYNPRVIEGFDCVTESGLKLIKKIRSDTIAGIDPELIETDNVLLMNINEEKITSICRDKRALPIRLLEMRGIRIIKQIAIHDLNTISNELEGSTKKVFDTYAQLKRQGRDFNEDPRYLVVPKLKGLGYVEGMKISSKQIRLIHKGQEDFLESKLPIMATQEDLSLYFKRIKKLTSIRQQNTLLRIYHGDIFCHERMSRMGMTDSDRCQTCNAVESREHLLLTCPKSADIWTKVNQILQRNGNPSLSDILGIKDKLPELKLRAEVLAIITRKDRNNLDGSTVVRMALEKLHTTDRSKGVKRLVNKIRNRLQPTV
jgi:hypothetical protein